MIIFLFFVICLFAVSAILLWQHEQRQKSEQDIERRPYRTRLNAQIVEMVERRGFLSVGYDQETSLIESLSAKLDKRDARINHLLDILHAQDAYIADQARLIHLAQQPINKPMILIHPN